MHHDHDHHHHDHEHTHCDHHHDHEHGHCGHHHDHEHCDHHHDHEHGHCNHGGCGGCGHHQHSPEEELVALMKYMVGHNASHAKELADLAGQLEKLGNRAAYEQVMAAVSDFEKGNMRLSVVLNSLNAR